MLGAIDLDIELERETGKVHDATVDGMLTTEPYFELPPSDMPPESSFSMVHLTAVGAGLIPKGSLDPTHAPFVQDAPRTINGSVGWNAPPSPAPSSPVLPPQAKGENEFVAGTPSASGCRISR